MLTSLLGLILAYARLVTPEDYPFNNPQLPWAARVDDLVGRLTLDEITQQMAQGGRTTYSPGIPRLGIKPYPWGAECLRGDIKAGSATSFPQAIGLAATFSRELLFNVTMATGEEVRAKFNNYSSHGYYGMHSSASCWSPVINILRDPRWGRNQETYGEDPYLAGELSAAYVRGLQGNHPRYIRANAGCKHFVAYGGPENIPISRHRFNAEVEEVDLRNTFFPAFKKCVQSGTYNIMCSYNSVNGIPACANKRFLTDILRKEWGFDGYVISDEGAIEDIMVNHKYTKSVEDTVAAAVLAGTNLEDGPSKIKPFFDAISNAVRHGKLTESFVREAVKPMFYTRMRLGLFDPPDMNPYSKLNVTDVVQCAKNRELSIKSALKSFVLLKNDGALPVSVPRNGVPFHTISIIGPMSNNTRGMFGGYPPNPDPRYITTPLKGLSGLGKTFTYTAGCLDDTLCHDYDSKAVKNSVTKSDFVVVCLGTGSIIEDESNDRINIQLPGKQLQLLQDAVQYSPANTPVALLLFNGGPLDVTWAVASPKVKAIVGCFFPAQGTGEALRRMFVREGEAANPGGRLPATWPAHLYQYPAITNYTMADRTYRYFRGDALFPFGYGLSYSRFTYQSLDVAPRVLRFTDVLLVEVYVVNTGPYDGDEVVQLYVSWDKAVLPSTPYIQLVGFERHFIKSGQGITCSFQVSMEQLALWEKDKFTVVPGSYALYAGGQQPHQKTQVPSNVLQTTFNVL